MVKLAKNIPKHKGNFQISVSFDVVGDLKNKEVQLAINEIEDAMRTAFQTLKRDWETQWWAEHKCAKLKNIKWNE